MKIIKTKDMPLLSRKRITAVEDVSGKTPSKQVVLKNLAADLKVKEDVIFLKHIYQQFGKGEAKIIAHVYTNPQELSRIEGIKPKKDKPVEKKEEVKDKSDGKEKSKEQSTK